MNVRRFHRLVFPLALGAAVLAAAACSGPRTYAPYRSSPRATTAPLPPGGVVTVRRGDTVYGIARRYRLPIRAVIQANRLRPPYLLRVGQRLRLPKPRLYVVAKGDTVYGISRRHGVDMATLMRLNGIGPPYRIKVGERLVLPEPDGVVKVAARSGSARAPDPGRPGAKTEAKRGAMETPPPDLTPPPRAGRRFLWPVRGRIISRFGPKRSGQHNDGINILTRRGRTVRAAENGVVAYAGNELSGFGNLLLLKHAGGWITAYAHNDVLLVKRGQRVRRGQPIARVGSTGTVARPQLHFEIRKGRRAVNPLAYLARRPTTASAASAAARPI